MTPVSFSSAFRFQRSAAFAAHAQQQAAAAAPSPSVASPKHTTSRPTSHATTTLRKVAADRWPRSPGCRPERRRRNMPATMPLSTGANERFRLPCRSGAREAKVNLDGIWIGWSRGRGFDGDPISAQARVGSLHGRATSGSAKRSDGRQRCVRSMMVVAWPAPGAKEPGTVSGERLGASAEPAGALHARRAGTGCNAARGRCRGPTPGSAGALADPVLRVELMNINNYGNDTPASVPWKVGDSGELMQPLPGWAA